MLFASEHSTESPRKLLCIAKLHVVGSCTMIDTRSSLPIMEHHPILYIIYKYIYNIHDYVAGEGLGLHPWPWSCVSVACVLWWGGGDQSNTNLWEWLWV